MKAIWIIVAAGIVPLLWSYAVYRFINRVWPPGGTRAGTDADSKPGYHVPDYQI